MKFSSKKDHVFLLLDGFLNLFFNPTYLSSWSAEWQFVWFCSLTFLTRTISN